MIINPNKLVESNNITGTFSVQPNAIDFSLDQLFHKEPTFTYLSNDKSVVKHKNHTPVELTDAYTARLLNSAQIESLEPDQVTGWLLQPNMIYDGLSSVYVKVPEGMCALIVGRSTLNRNAVLLTSGLYDSGFEGNIGFALHNRLGTTFIEKGTMVGQIIFFDAETAHMYKGHYNTENGQHWSDAVSAKTVVEPKVVEVPIEQPTQAEPVVETPVETITAPDVSSVVEIVAAPKEPRPVKRR